MRKRILYVEHSTDGTIGGSHLALLRLVRELDRSRYAAVVAFYQEHGLLGDFRRHADEVLVLPKPRAVAFKPAVARRAANLVVRVAVPVLRAARLLRARRIDLVHLNNSLVHGQEWMLAARLTGARCVIHQRGYGYGAEVNRRLARFVDAIVCISDDIRRDLIARGVSPAAKVVTMHDALDAVGFRDALPAGEPAVRHALGVPDGAPLVGIVGNIKEWKGQHVLVQALTHLLPEFPDLRCLIVGQVPRNGEDERYARRLTDLVARLDLGGVVTLTGYRPDVPAVMNALDVVVHASIEPEPFGLVVLEAMALGKPVLATDLGGPREIIDHGVTGFLVPPADPAALAATLARLLHDEVRRKEVGIAAQRAVEERFSAGGLTRRVERLYGELLAS